MADDVHSVEFLGSDRICSATATFSFARPDGYTFTPGQYMELTLETREGVQTKPFSHADAPKDGAAQILTRLTGSAFKDALLALSPGDSVTLRGPRGALTVPPGARRVGFLVGGVGLSPAMSIMRDAVQRASGLDIVAFIANQDETCMPFAAELEGDAGLDSDLMIVQVLSSPSDAWTGERGRISADTVRRHCELPADRHWIIAGPPAMVTAMRAVLVGLGVPADAAASEMFVGYR